ncbi:hypothetical protein HrrHc1_090 [Halorubrum phage Hardycor1]|nr:hypothetical protein HrrHc1_090 [Halorubrum phage Hardycor1]
MTSLNDPKVVLKNLLAAEWDETNTHGVTPEFRTGWRDGDLDAPQVTTGPDDESPTSDTGFTGIAPDGSGPTARVRGSVNLNVWTSREVLDGVNPKLAADEITGEARRIVRDHYDISAHPTVDAENYRYISWFGRTFMPEEPQEPEAEPIYRYLAEVRYEYLDRR